MEPDAEEKELNARMEARFKELPKVVQDAITSADVAKKLRELSDTHKLHLDQWEALENEVMLTLLGFQEVEKLEENIKSEVNLSPEAAHALAGDIAEHVFEPIRQELQRETEPQAPQDVPAAPLPLPPVPLPTPATPPSPPPAEKSVRAPASSSYASQSASHERPTIEGDPYREPIS